MEALEWFAIGAIVVAALDQIVDQTKWKEHNIVQLILTGLKAVFRVKS